MLLAQLLLTQPLLARLFVAQLLLAQLLLTQPLLARLFVAQLLLPQRLLPQLLCHCTKPTDHPTHSLSTSARKKKKKKSEVTQVQLMHNI
jgi:hypothetical protein